MKNFFLNIIMNVKFFFHGLKKKHKHKEIFKKLSELGFIYSPIFDCPTFDDSIIGVTKDGRVVYVYDYMGVEFAEDNHKDYYFTDDETRLSYIDEAIEFIDYNTIRTIPYMGSLAPIVVSWDDENEKLVVVSESEYKDFYFNEDTCYIIREDIGQYYSKEEPKDDKEEK